MAIIIVMALPWLCGLHFTAHARNDGKDAAVAVGPGIAGYTADAMTDSLTVSFITCYPGPEIYELYGHEAVRVRGEGRDSVWNYGIFNFREPNFVYRFVKGETDYMVAGYPFAWFMPEYQERGSKVVEQDLNLTQEEARKLLEMLQTESLPENRRYRYNYVKNNCATRIHELLDSAISPRVIYPDSVRYGTFRNEMRAYNRNYPWYQLGIDIALGSGMDYPLKAREEMFVPVEMMRQTENARIADGRRLVRATRILNEGVADATLPPTPVWASPMVIALMTGLLLTGVSVYCLKRRRIVKWIFSLWFLILGLAGTLVAFLVFISSHEATSPNTLLIWLNPLQLVMGMCLWWRRTRAVATAMAYYNIVGVVCMLVVWPFQHQSANPALFPLMAATLAMAAVYAIIAAKESYNNNGHALSGTVAVNPQAVGRKAGTSSIKNIKRKAAAKRKSK